MRWSIRRQIMWPLLVVAAASLTAVGAINAQLAARHTRQQIEAQLQGVVSTLATSNFPLTGRVLRQMRDLSSAEFVLTDAAGQPLAASLHELATPLPPAPDAAEPLRLLALGPTIDVQGVSYFHTVASLPPRDQQSTGRVLHILFPEAEYRRSWREAFAPSLAVGLVTLAATAAVAHILSRRISRATARLGADVLRMARGDFTPTALPAIDDEIRDLSSAVNQTAGMLADYEQQIRRTEQMRTVALLGAGLAHEMRNAATGCRMALDLHAQACNGHGDADSLSVAKRQLRLMETQLQRFLQAGKPISESAKRQVDLAELVEDMLALVRPAARHADASIEWTPPTCPAIVLADREALGQVALNLMLNAVEAVQQSEGPAERAIHVRLETANAQASLEVSDNGPGPSDALVADLFEPFVTSKAEGIGLGLAVARQVIDAHAGVIGYHRTDGVTRFRVEIPLKMKG